MQNHVLAHRLDDTVVVTDPMAVTNVKYVSDVVALRCLLAVVIDNSEQFVGFLFHVIFRFGQ
jgi:hypothetical protein